MLICVAVGRSPTRAAEKPVEYNYNPEPGSNQPKSTASSTYVEYETDWEKDKSKKKKKDKKKYYYGHHNFHGHKHHHVDVIGSVFALCILFGCLAVIGIILERKRLARIKEFMPRVKEEKSELINSENEGQPIFVTGTLTVEGSPTDPYFAVITEGQPVLERKVEVYCWKETKTKFKEKRTVKVQDSSSSSSSDEEDQVRKGTKYEYQAVWSDKFIDSSKFKDKSKDENIKPSLDNEEWKCSGVRLGSYYIEVEKVCNVAIKEQYR